MSLHICSLSSDQKELDIQPQLAKNSAHRGEVIANIRPAQTSGQIIETKALPHQNTMYKSSCFLYYARQAIRPHTTETISYNRNNPLFAVFLGINSGLIPAPIATKSNIFLSLGILFFLGACLEHLYEFPRSRDCSSIQIQRWDTSWNRIRSSACAEPCGVTAFRDLAISCCRSHCFSIFDRV